MSVYLRGKIDAYTFSGLRLGAADGRPPWVGLAPSFPFTLACWFFPIQTGTNRYLISVSSSGTNLHGLRLKGNVGGYPIQAFSTSGGSNGEANISNAVKYNAWNVAFAAFESTSSRYVALNGSAVTQNTTLVSASPPYSSLAIGDVSDYLQQHLYQFQPFAGFIAHVAIYNTVLNASDSAALHKGANPLQVRPQNLVAYFPFTDIGQDRNIAPAKNRANVLANWPNVGVRYSNWNPPVEPLRPEKTKIAFDAAAQNNSPIFYHQRQQQGMAS
jgi:hypothetical protein